MATKAELAQAGEDFFQQLTAGIEGVDRFGRSGRFILDATSLIRFESSWSKLVRVKEFVEDIALVTGTPTTRQEIQTVTGYVHQKYMADAVGVEGM